MRSEPIAKGGNKRWLMGRILTGFARANPACNEVMMEELHSKLGVKADLSALEMRASATAKMTAKGIKQFEIDVLQNAALPLHEAAEMGGGANVPNGACRC